MQSIGAVDTSERLGGSGRGLQGVITLASGLLLMFAAVGFGAWFSGAVSWVGFYLGARAGALVALAQVTTAVGFAAAVATTLAWYGRRWRRGRTDIPPRAALAACLALPLGNIFWAVFVDAIAYHYGEDIVRPAFDLAVMYLVLGALLPLGIGIPCLVLRLRRPLAAAPPGPPLPDTAAAS